MTGIIVALIFIVGAICLMAGGMVSNRMSPDYSSALAVPLLNALSIALTLIGVAISFIVYNKNKDMTLAKQTLIWGIVCLILLVVLFPLSNSGSLSIVR